MSKTICAIATPLQAGGLGVIRISGENAFLVADRVFKSVSKEKLANLKGYTARFGHVHNNGEIIDEAVALVFKSPKSYTGEDVVEFSVHGGVFVQKKLLRTVMENGAVLAQPGEFTKRAFLNGKLDLAQAESVAAIISAESEQALNASLSAKDGNVSKKINSVKQILLDAAASVAAFSDYPDEEPSFSGINSLMQKLTSAELELEKLIKNYDSGKIYREGVNTAIVGKPNVGKSTLMNLLSGTERSIVTEIAGTTRDIVEETVSVNGIKLKLSDTAGLRETEDTVEKIGVTKAKERILSSDLILAVFDSSKPLTLEDTSLLNSLKGKHAIAILNKNDLIQKLTEDQFEKFGIKTVSISAKDELGIEKLKLEITGLLVKENLSPDSIVLSSERQRECVVSALNNLKTAKATMEEGFTIDAVGVCIDDSLNSLLELTGERATIEVTNEVFSKFCVGK